MYESRASALSKCLSTAPPTTKRRPTVPRYAEWLQFQARRQRHSSNSLYATRHDGSSIKPPVISSHRKPFFKRTSPAIDPFPTTLQNIWSFEPDRGSLHRHSNSKEEHHLYSLRPLSSGVEIALVFSTGTHQSVRDRECRKVTCAYMLISRVRCCLSLVCIAVVRAEAYH